MTQKIIDVSELLQLSYQFTAYGLFGGSAENFNVVDVDDLRALLDKAPSVSSEVVALAWYREGNTINPNFIEHINEKGGTVYIEFRMSTPPPNRGWIPLYTTPQHVSGEAVYQCAVRGNWMDTNLENYIKHTGVKRTLYTPQQDRVAELEAEHESMVKIMALSYTALQATNKKLLDASKNVAEWCNYPLGGAISINAIRSINILKEIIKEMEEV